VRGSSQPGPDQAGRSSFALPTSLMLSLRTPRTIANWRPVHQSKVIRAGVCGGG